MKSFAIFCFLLLASACIFAVRAEEESKEVDTPKADEQPEVAADEQQADETEDEAANDEEEEANDEEEDEEELEDETESDEEELDEEEQEKRGLVKFGKCTRWRYGKLWCIGCRCRKVCRSRWCTRRQCRRYVCGKRLICRFVTRYRIVKRRVKVNVGKPYYPKWIWKVITKKLPYRVRVCKRVPKFCTRCSTRRYVCGNICTRVCIFRKCRPYGYPKYPLKG